MTARISHGQMGSRLRKGGVLGCQAAVTRFALRRLDGAPPDVLGALAGCDAGRPPPAAVAEALFRADQLQAVMAPDAAESHPLQAFSEPGGPRGAPWPAFAPTYKLMPGSSAYDGRRTPSWTDRVLFRCNYSHWRSDAGAHSDAPARPGLAAMWYDSVPGLEQSDHRPVVARLALRLKHAPGIAADGVAGSTPPAMRDGKTSLGRARTFAQWAARSVSGRRRSLEALDQPLRSNVAALGRFVV